MGSLRPRRQENSVSEVRTKSPASRISIFAPFWQPITTASSPKTGSGTSLKSIIIWSMQTRPMMGHLIPCTSTQPLPAASLPTPSTKPRGSTPMVLSFGASQVAP